MKMKRRRLKARRKRIEPRKLRELHEKWTRMVIESFVPVTFESSLEAQ